MERTAAYSEEDQQKAYLRLSGRLGQLLKPKPRLNIWQWADSCRYLAKGTSARSLEGPELYRSADAPHQRKPQESPLDPAVQCTVLIMASQIGGKTEIFNNVLGYHMDHSPRSCVVMYPQLDAAEKYSKKKFQPMVEATPCLAGLIKPARSRDSGNTILVKEFNGGSVFFVGANSPPSLRGVFGAVLLGDEVDSMKPNAEGDPIELLWKRGESVDCVKMLASTPTVKGASIIWDWFEASDQEYWFVPCPKCGAYQALKWHQVVWPKGAPEKAELICSSCAAALNDRQRLEMYFAGEWRATAPFKGIRGFHLNGIYAPWPAQRGFEGRLHQMAVDFLRAEKKGDSAKQVWVNTFCCELWEVESERVDPGLFLIGKSGEEQIKESRMEGYSPESLPAGVVVVCASVDVQADRLECETIGLGLNHETWGIEYSKFYGDTEKDEVWKQLGEHLVKRYKRADGVELEITATGIDTGFRPDRVVAFIKRGGVPRCYALHGANREAPSPALVTSTLNKLYKLRFFSVNGRIAKDTIFARLKMDQPGPRYMHFPHGNGYDVEYFLQLMAEKKIVKNNRGVRSVSYEKQRNRNEALDIRVYFHAVVDILKPALGVISKKLEALRPGKTPKDGAHGSHEPHGPPGDPPPTAQEKIEQSMAKYKATKPPFVPRKPGGGFVGGWK